MKKSLVIALPVLSFALLHTASAESSVTMYGILDAGYGYSQYKYDHNGTHARSTSSGLYQGFLNSNRWGMKGSEDLGNGLRAVFTLESKFKIGDGSGKGGFNRKAFVGLSSNDWGTFTMGRQKSISDDFNGANTVKSLGKTSRAFGGSGVTVDNMFKYVSPSFGGLQAGISYAANGSIIRNSDEAENSDRSNFLSVGLLYKSGPLRLSGSYDRQSGAEDKSPAGEKIYRSTDYAVQNWMLAASYDFEIVKLSLAYGQDKNGKLNKPGDVDKKIFNGAKIPAFGDYNNRGFKSHNYMAGINAPLGAGILGVSWTHTSSNLDDIYDNDDASFKSQNIYAANYRYPLSKRTTLVAYGAYGTGIAYLDGFKVKEIGLGLNHKF